LTIIPEKQKGETRVLTKELHDIQGEKITKRHR